MIVFREAVRCVDIFSPNHVELANLFGHADASHVTKEEIETYAVSFVVSGVGPERQGVVVVRAGEHGCLVVSDAYRARWLPAYYGLVRSSGKVVDPTGAGNTFLGAFTICYIESGDLFLSACHGNVAASFAIEQIGLPSLERHETDGTELWNGVSVSSRLDQYLGLLQTSTKLQAQDQATPHTYQPFNTTMGKIIIYIMGASGAGKGTQCSRLAQKYRLKHLSVGDILRAESRREPKSKYADIILSNMQAGTIGPMEITVELLRRAMDDCIAEHGISMFLLDGFPRKSDQLELFERTIQPADFAVYLECDEETRLERLMQRGKGSNSSTRTDDNIETIRGRFSTFAGTTLPIIRDLSLHGRLVRVNGASEADAVFEEMERVLGRW